jgi:hypothetical protein
VQRNKRILLQIIVAGALLIGTSACAHEVSTGPELSGAESTSIGTNGQLISIQSDNVQMSGYDASSQIMKVQFDNGALYEYYGVSPDLWTDFLAAQPHPWSEVGYPRLVQGGIPYKRIS